ncbi:acyl-CoA dehydrogenase family protein [Streptomyces mangrovisoli]|uniref:Acyl-CoA dehydrogenase n=1 Tax=Streptomyces mangrovisoli TaxID=1428628 RepID=A0A1J4NTY9_9ACTN|nr:acyl-CoA dehydrogenase family protein [Streptomyces mangrovisoli]OIJ65004.1 hypothetical protein WN71_025720 [Streptomyces mangrovisoli]
MNAAIPADVPESESVLTAVQKIAEEIRDRVEDVERARRLPADLHALLRGLGVYRLILPTGHGGIQASVTDVLDVIETLATIDGSVAWTTAIGIQSPAVLSWLPRKTFDDLYAAGPDVTVGGAFGPQGTAEIVDGGYRVSGRWSFASGCDNWDHLFANCVLTRNGKPVEGPGGQPRLRAMLFAKDRASFLDTWHTLGLRGTGSKDFTLDEVFVADDHSFDIATAAPCVEGISRYPLIEFGHHLATIAIGVAQGALNDLSDSAAERRRALSRTTVAANPTVQHRIGKAETGLRAARELVRRQAALQRADGQDGDFAQLMAVASANNAWVVDTCIGVVDTCFRAYGARGIYNSSAMQRRLRDIYTIAQHATLNDGAWTRHGAALFGQETGLLV